MGTNRNFGIFEISQTLQHFGWLEVSPFDIYAAVLVEVKPIEGDHLQLVLHHKAQVADGPLLHGDHVGQDPIHWKSQKDAFENNFHAIHRLLIGMQGVSAQRAEIKR